MTSLIKRKKDGKTLYYLKYSSRTNPQQKYLGIKLQKDIKKQLIDFELLCYRKKILDT